MSSEILRQTSWNSGELDPDLLGRSDVTVSRNAAARIENCLCIPQGPLTRRPGLPRVDIVRHPLAAIDYSGATLTAPNGGDETKLAANDGDPLLTTADLAATDGYVVVEIDFGAAVTFHAVDLVDYGLHDTSGGGTAPAPVTIGYPWGAIGPIDVGGFYNLL
jgi:hypothetical protein